MHPTVVRSFLVYPTNSGQRRSRLINFELRNETICVVNSYVVGTRSPRRIAGLLLIPLSNSSLHSWINSNGISTEAFPFPNLLMVKLWCVSSVDWRCKTSLSSKIVGSNKNRLDSEARKVSIERWYQAWSDPAGAASQPLIATLSIKPAKSFTHFSASVAKDKDCASWTTAEGRCDHSMNNMHGCSL